MFGGKLHFPLWHHKVIFGLLDIQCPFWPLLVADKASIKYWKMGIAGFILKVDWQITIGSNSI